MTMGMGRTLVAGLVTLVFGITAPARAAEPAGAAAGNGSGNGKRGLAERFWDGAVGLVVGLRSTLRVMFEPKATPEQTAALKELAEASIVYAITAGDPLPTRMAIFFPLQGILVELPRK